MITYSLPDKTALAIVFDTERHLRDFVENRDLLNKMSNKICTPDTLNVFFIKEMESYECGAQRAKLLCIFIGKLMNRIMSVSRLTFEVNGPLLE